MTPDIFVVDTETTGVVDPIYIVEYAHAQISDDLGVIDEFTTLIKPPISIPCDASGVHYIRNEDVEGCMSEEEILWPKGEVIIISHNIPYDKKILARHMNIVGTCCTLRLSRRMLPDAPDHKLSTLSCYCGLPKQLNHRALNDVRDCLGLLDYLAEGSGMNLWQLIDYNNKPVELTTMPWGKHKGADIDKLPSGYVKWLSGLTDLDIDMVYTLKKHYKYAFGG